MDVDVSSINESSINCKITGNRGNRGAGNGLEISCEYSADSDRQAVVLVGKENFM